MDLTAELTAGIAFVRNLNYELAGAAMNPTQQLTIRVESLKDLLYCLTSQYMPGEVCDVIRSQYDCFSFTSDNPIEWPLPNVRFVVLRWDASEDDVEVASIAYCQWNITRWAYREGDESSIRKMLAWQARHGAWEDFDILKSFQISCREASSV